MSILIWILIGFLIYFVVSRIEGLVSLVIILNKIIKTEAFAANKETIVSLFKKMCKMCKEKVQRG